MRSPWCVLETVQLHRHGCWTPAVLCSIPLLRVIAKTGYEAPSVVCSRHSSRSHSFELASLLARIDA